MQYEIYVLPIDEVNCVGLSHCTNDRRQDDKSESFDREHYREKCGEGFLSEVLLYFAPFLYLICQDIYCFTLLCLKDHMTTWTNIIPLSSERRNVSAF